MWTRSGLSGYTLARAFRFRENFAGFWIGTVLPGRGRAQQFSAIRLESLIPGISLANEIGLGWPLTFRLTWSCSLHTGSRGEIDF